MRELIINSVPMRDPQQKWYVDYTKSQSMPQLSRARTSDELYGFHGDPGNQIDSYFGTGLETWVINLDCQTKEEHNTILRGLLLLFQQDILDGLSAPQRTALSPSARYGAGFSGVAAADLWSARLQLQGEPALERLGESFSRLTVILQNLDAFWMTQSYFTSSPFTPGTNLILDATAGASTAPITDIIARIKGPILAGGSVTVQDRGNPFRSFTYKATTALASTEYVVIEVDTLTAKLQTSDTWDLTTGTDVSSRVTSSGDGSFYLSPAVGSGFPTAPSAYKIDIVAVSAASSATEIRLRRSFLA